MYTLIDELIATIQDDDLYKDYIKNEKALYNKQLIPLLSRQQQLQTDYLSLRHYLDEQSLKTLKKDLQDVKKEVSMQPLIQNYYQSYYEFNELLETITKIVFQGISETITIEKWK